MNPRILQYLQNALLTAVTVVLFLVVLSAFLRVIRPPAEVAPVAANGITPTTLAADDGVGAAATTVAPAEEDETSVTPAPGEPPVCREPIPPAGSGTVLRVYYPCGLGDLPNTETFAYREVPETDLVLTNTLEQMVLGPDDEERALGFTSVFSEATTRSFASVRIDSGRAVIDFTGLEDIESLNSDAAAEFFLATLGANVFQFDTISSAEYRLGGSCDAFYALLERECAIVTRQSWNQQVAQWRSS